MLMLIFPLLILRDLFKKLLFVAVETAIQSIAAYAIIGMAMALLLKLSYNYPKYARINTVGNQNDKSGQDGMILTHDLSVCLR